jgi:hypothetical protein
MNAAPAAGEKTNQMAARMSQTKELWEELRVGDRVRLTEIPAEFFQDGYFLHRDTMRAYKKLLARRRSLRVYKIDEWGLPWVQFRFRRKSGEWEYHSLAINHSGLARVRPRRRVRQAVRSTAKGKQREAR